MLSWRAGDPAHLVFAVEREPIMRNAMQIPRFMILIALAGLTITACSHPALDPPSAAPGASDVRSIEPPPPPGAGPELQAVPLPCQPPLRECINCNGALICTLRCPVCRTISPQSEGLPSTVAFGPVTESCGSTI
jgi:hypothetical protein